MMISWTGKGNRPGNIGCLAGWKICFHLWRGKYGRHRCAANYALYTVASIFLSVAGWLPVETFYQNQKCLNPEGKPIREAWADLQLNW